MLNIKRNQVECELGSAPLLLVLKNEFEVSGLILSTKSNAVVCVGQLHDFGKECNIDTKYHSCVCAVMFESLHAQIETHERDM